MGKEGALRILSSRKKLNEFFTLVADGISEESASRIAGFDYRDFQDLLKMAELDPSPAMKRFLDKYHLSLAQSEKSLLEKLENASSTEWQKYAWMLERRFPQSYSKPESRHRFGGGVRIEVVRRTPRPYSRTIEEESR